MRYTTYGQTEKKVSVVGFGGMRFDQEGRSDEENAEVVRYACSKGINYFDTAPGYGRSEDIYGIAFKDMPGDFLVSTKLSPGGDKKAEDVRELVQKSLDRMGVDKINFFHVWCLRNMADYEMAVKPGGLYDGLVKCKEEGIIDHIAVSSHQPGAEIKRVVESGHFDAALMSTNVLNFPYRRGAIEAAAAQGMGVAAMNPLGGGTIPKHEKELAFLARDGETVTQAALRFIIGCPQVNIALVGFSSKEQVDFACDVADKAEAMSEEDLDRVREHIGENIEQMCTGCSYCKECPSNIPVPSYMQVYNEKSVFGKTDEEMAGIVGFNHRWGVLVGPEATAEACTQCGQCEEACTQHLPIMERMKEMAAWEAVE